MKVVDNAKAGRFEAEVGGEHAVAWYRLRGETIVFIHTEVPESMRGKGIGDALARAALESARERNLRVVPMCPFFAAFIRRHPEMGGDPPDRQGAPTGGDETPQR